jgi:hypothetical protein
MVVPTARVAHVGTAAATATFAALPTALVVVRGGSELGMAVVLLALGSGAALAWAVDDPAADLLASTPVSAPVRAAVRVCSAAVAVAAVCSAALSMVALDRGLPPDTVDRAPEAATAATLGLAVGFASARRGDRLAGASGAVAAVVVPALVAACAVRWPAQLPTFSGGGVHGRWWVLAAFGAVAVVHGGRDPSRR